MAFDLKTRLAEANAALDLAALARNHAFRLAYSVLDGAPLDDETWKALQATLKTDAGISYVSKYDPAGRDSTSITQMAKEFGMPPSDLLKHMVAEGWLTPDSTLDRNMPTKAAIEAGYLVPA